VIVPADGLLYRMPALQWSIWLALMTAVTGTAPLLLT